MFKAIRDLFGSKKFLMTLIGSVAYLVLMQLGVPDEQALSILGMFGLSVVGQGIADSGKEAAKVEAGIAARTAELDPAARAAALRAEALGGDDSDDS